LIGNFNGHLKDAFFICLDEATFGGDIKESNKLKTFISESQRTINDKYKSQYSISCYSKLFILSNNDYIVNVEQSDRRYMVLRANDKLKGNFKWFDNYQKWLRNGGYEAIMFYLLNRDISNFNPLDIPKTQEKTDLQLKSSDMPTKFLYDILAGNVTFRESMIVGNKIYRTELYEEFVDYCRRYSSKGYIQTTTEFNKVVVKAFDFQKPNWRQNWKDKKGYYYEMDSLFDFQEKFALNLFKTKAEDLFFNLKQNNEETTQQEIDSVFYKDEQK
jgi:phage/plasmid-associated DNA primase